MNAMAGAPEAIFTLQKMTMAGRVKLKIIKSWVPV